MSMSHSGSNEPKREHSISEEMLVSKARKVAAAKEEKKNVILNSSYLLNKPNKINSTHDLIWCPDLLKKIQH